MIFDAVVIAFLVLACGLLLFPVKVRFLFRGEKKAGALEIRLFRWKVFRAGEDPENADGEAQTEKVSEPTVEWVEEKRAERNSAERASAEVRSERNVQRDEPVRAETSSQEKGKGSRKKNEKSDSEFLTLALEPGFDRTLLKGASRMAKAFFRIFRCRFESTVVEGIRLDSFASMGMAGGALDFFAATVPLFEDWEFRMDWEGTRPLRIEGCLAASFSLARILGFVLVSLRWVAALAWIYLKNRRRLKKNPEAFRLVLWRRLVVRFLSTEGG